MSGEVVLFNFRKGFDPLREAFEELGLRVRLNIWEPDRATLRCCRVCLLNLYEGIRNPMRTLALRRRLDHAHVPLVGIDRDAPWHMGIRRRRLWLFALLKPLDIYATHTMQPTWEFAPRKLYNPNAVWSRHFNLHGRTLEQMRSRDFFQYDVSFVGNLDGKRYKEHAERQRFLMALEERLRPLGRRVLFKHSSGVPEAQQIEIIQRSIINLNYRSSCDHGGTLSWGLPERCYGVPARGGFLLSDPRRHASDDFDVTREWAEFQDLDHCVARIDHYLRCFEETRAIAEAAHLRVMSEHTYMDRARKLIAEADQWRARGAA